MKKLGTYCICGGSAELTLGGGQKATTEATEAFALAFWDVHQGEGHGATTKDEATKARSTWDRQIVAQLDVSDSPLFKEGTDK